LVAVCLGGLLAWAPIDGLRAQVAAPAPARLLAVHVTADDSTGVASPPESWTPASESGGGVRLNHQPGQPLDAAWVRRQFEENGIPGPNGTLSVALDVVQIINRAFLSAGFINSGLVVRPSDTPDLLELRIIYGHLVAPATGGRAIEVSWAGGRARGLDADYIENRMWAARRQPLSAVDLERDFRLLAEDPAIRTINADLRPGSQPGEASLAVTVLPHDRFDLYVTAANNRSPTVGSERIALGGYMRNLLAAGDVIGGELGATDGIEDVSINYARPFLSPRSSVFLRGALNQAVVIDTLLQSLDIKARDRFLEVGLTQKLVDAPLLPRAGGGWSSARSISVGGSVAWRSARAFLLGTPFSFAPGASGGRSEYAVLRLVGDYLVRNVDRVFAVSVTGTLGLDGTRSDITPEQSPDRNFKAVLAQVNYARRLSGKGLELRARASGQWSSSLLYAGERFSAGGATTVRGYRENILLADQGIVASLELVQPLRLSGRRGAAQGFDWGAVSVSAFVDGAAMRNHDAPQPRRTIYSVGSSLTWTPTDAVSAQITYGRALQEIEPPGRRNIQDRGLQARITVYPLRVFR
jgi:hemolysin activation/secretion protein